MHIFLYSFLFIIGLTLAGFGLNQYQKTRRLLTEGIKTEATVIELTPVKGSKGSTLYKPVIQYSHRSGRVITFLHSVSSSPPAYEVGEKVKIVYDAQKEGESKIMSYWSLYLFPILLFIFAWPFLVIGGGYLLYIFQI